MSDVATQAPVAEPGGEVVSWRFDELRRAGYEERAAFELAQRGDVDLHLALDLVRRGCPYETALRILR